jgi:hypothetical protein
MLFVGTLFCVGALPGCSSGKVEVQAPLDDSQKNLVAIGRAYDRYLSESKKPPTNAEQLKSYLKQDGNPDELLRSPRDGEPYVICWGVDLNSPPSWAKSIPVIAYEKRGKDGKRWVLTTMRVAQPLSEEEFQNASFPPGHTRADK